MKVSKPPVLWLVWAEYYKWFYIGTEKGELVL